MAFGIDAKFDPGDVNVLLRELQPRQLQFATVLTLTRVGRIVKNEEQSTMRSTLDRPTPFTMNSLQLRTATMRQPEARVWFKDPPRFSQREHYLEPQVHGGPREDKRFERALQRKGFLRKGKQLVPGSGAPLDAYGNVRRGLHTRIMSQLGAHFDPTQNESAKSRKRNRRARAGRFFYGNPGGMGWGVWERTRGNGRVFGGRMNSRGLVPVFLETRRHHYKPRFPFFAVAERVTGRSIQPEFNKAAEYTFRTARR